MAVQATETDGLRAFCHLVARDGLGASAILQTQLRHAIDLADYISARAPDRHENIDKVTVMARASELSMKQLDLISAGQRHVRDAEGLLDIGNARRSVDQAVHLAGFGPECVRKALLGDRIFDKVLGHRFDSGTEVVVDAALALDPRARRYAPHGWGARYPALAKWSEQSRYRKTGSFPEAVAAPLVSQAASSVGETVAALFADGRIPSNFPW